MSSKIDLKSNKNNISLSVEEWHRLAVEGAQLPVTFSPDGDSMRPLLRKNRDTVTVVPVYRKLKKGDIVLFIRYDGACVVHRVYRIKGETVVTLGDACHGFDTPIPARNVMGIAVRADRDGRILNLDSSFSRLSGIIWMHTRKLRILRRKIRRFISAINKNFQK